MGDLIDRLKAIDAIDGALLDEVIEGIVIDILLDLPSAHPELNEWCHDCKEYDPEKGCCPRWGQVIRTALEDAKPEQRWVSCSERLPEPDQICIVTDDERLGAYEYGFHSENHDEIDGWTFLGRKIIAWMPLPEPYREEGEE